MQPESVIIYERVLKGERWPSLYVGTATTKERGIEILRYLFFEKLGIKDFETAKKLLNRDFIREYKLKKVLLSFERPEEFFPGEYDYILWELFPERRRGKRSLTEKVYSEVLSGKRSGFPRGYFTDPAEGRYRADVCVKYLCKKILHYSGDRIAMEFSHSNGIKTLAKYKLKIVLNHVYFSLSGMMYQVFPQYCDKLEDYQHLQDGRYHRKKRGEKNGNRKCVCNASGEEIGDSRKAE